MWLALFIMALAALGALHLWWRHKLRRAQLQARMQLERHEQASQQSAFQLQSQQEAVLNSMVEGLVMLDHSGRIELANRAFLMLFDLQGDVRGKTLLETIRLHELSQLVIMLQEGESVLGHQLTLSRPAERWLEVNGAAILNGDGRRQGALLVFHDLTRLKKLERTREEFVANVSHELRTPLSLIKGYAETLLDGAKDNPDVADKFLHTINRNAERLRLLIEDLLTISELESGRIQLELQSIGLRAFVDKVFVDLKSRADSKQIKLVNAVSEQIVRADNGRLEQVFGNLIDNAIKYGLSGGIITVGARLKGNKQVEIFVQDDGPGIPEDALERLFERFYRVDKARSREQGGTGLGLAIVKHIVQNHGGKVWAVSQLGKGATFFFTLPEG